MAANLVEVKVSFDKPLQFSQAPKKDFTLSFAELKKMADSADGDASAQLLVGQSFRHCWNGCVANIDEGNKYIVIAAKSSGTPAGMCAQGLCYEYAIGEVVIKNAENAKRCYAAAADKGYVPAMYQLALQLYSEALTTVTSSRGEKIEHRDKQIMVQAIGLLNRGAEQRFAPALAMLGHCYWGGQGVSQDNVEAVRLFRMAAETGFAYAKFKMGYHYQYGLGVEKSTSEARKWYQLAIDQGFGGQAVENLKDISGCCCSVM